MTDLGSHHLDRRAGTIAEGVDSSGNPDDLLTSAQTAHLLGYSKEWVECGRSRGWGPPFIRLSPRRVRYRRGDIKAWLNERRHRSTKEYDTFNPFAARRKDAPPPEDSSESTTAAP
jgi:predicted DNA-binding transcriptional regulator AlpA